MTAPRILFSGYFGFGNFGDDAILYCMARQFKKMRPDAELSVLTQNAVDDVCWLYDADTKESFGVKPYKRMKPMDVLHAVKNCDLFISGGGGLFQDTTSVKSVVYYAGLIHLALQMKKKVMIFSQGLGPLNKPLSQKIVSLVLRNIHDATFRDEASCALAKKLSCRDFECAADPVFLLELPLGIPPSQEEFPIRTKNIKNDRWKHQVGIALRKWEHHSFYENFSVFVKSVAKEDTRLLLFYSQASEDEEISKQVMRDNSNNAVGCGITYPPFATLLLFRFSNVFLCMRYHSAVCAFLAGKPALGFSYDPKVKALFDAFGLSEFCLPLDASAEQMGAAYEKLMLEKEAVVSSITKTLPAMRERALKSFNKALQLVP